MEKVRTISKFEKEMRIERNSNRVTIDMITTCKRAKTAINRLYKAVETTNRLEENEREALSSWLDDSQSFIETLNGKTIAKETYNNDYDGWIIELECDPDIDQWYIRVTLPLGLLGDYDTIQEIPSQGSFEGHEFKSEKRAKARTFIEFKELNRKGEKIYCEISIIDGGMTTTYYEHGWINHPYMKWISLDTYIYDKNGACWGNYNPTAIDGKVNMSLVLPATETNLKKILHEFIKCAYGTLEK